MTGGIMEKHNGTQLYGFGRMLATLRMGMHPELRGVSLKKRFAMYYVTRESKMTRLGKEIYTNTFTPYFPSPAYDRFIKGAVDISRGVPVPVVTNFAVTPRCPCNCWHCSFADRSKQEVLTLDVMKEAIRKVQDLGSSVIGFTGGEPLLRDDFEEIVASVDHRSMPIMFTTGYELTRQRVKRLKEAGLKIPVISLDHYLPEIHDRGRRKKGMYDYALNAIRLFKEEGFYVAVSFVPNRELVSDRKEMFKIIDFFKTLGVNDMRLTSPILSGHLTSKNDRLLSRENVRTIYEIQKKCTASQGYPGVFAYDFFEGKDYYGCGAGYTYMFIDSQGNVCPCDFTMLSFGNILERSIGEIWKETTRHFPRPGLSCYANAASRVIASKAGDAGPWPLSPEKSMEVVTECPTHHPTELPEFYRRAGL
jgi:MoaA/NifB/PqqE/SkfB family radical SAM enzyme